MEPFQFRGRLHHQPVREDALCEDGVADESGALFVARLARWGHSVAVRVPREALKEAGLAEGSVVDVEITRRHVLDFGAEREAVTEYCRDVAARIGWTEAEVQYLLAMSAILANPAGAGKTPPNPRQAERFAALQARVAEFHRALGAAGLDFRAHLEQI